MPRDETLSPAQPRGEGVSPPPVTIVEMQRTNALGTVALVTTVLGVFTCGALLPVGFVLGVCGMFSRPRGQATAAVILSALGMVAALAIYASLGVFVLETAGG